MKSYQEMTREELSAELEKLRKSYKEFQAKGLKLNMARGKPCAEQLELSMPMLDVLNSVSSLQSEDGTDCRNYGVLDGIQEAKKLFADIMEVSPEETMVFGSSSLTIMYDTISRAMTHGVLGSEKPWGKYDKVKFLCPVPGYDRHFAITEFFGIEMINVEMNEDGPDMDEVERLAASDETIKGIWCVPKYSNPLGGTYSDETVRRMAALKPAAKDFRIFWDNAYCVHFIYRNTHLLNLLEECKKAGNPNMAFLFGSTSKITFPGAGVAFMACSVENAAFIKKQIAFQSIGWDKLNMLRHARFFKNKEGVMAHMEKHAALLRPRFDAVIDAFQDELEGLGVGSWVKPDGGYFITYTTLDGCAKRVVALCREAGVEMTGAGATHPYKKDPRDAAIRIAPSYPSIKELKQAVELFCLSVKIASCEKLLAQ
ncbi:MAG TPA: aminotransferase class I/II-fold pyridoxal phosphate-dependent enzyme [Candidatus Fimivivens faecavium]|nr:aminotransferase class I/II-fold pyridoxal phosphate-dependent enzyme [Candidatus Fimivivens faecavium]